MNPTLFVLLAVMTSVSLVFSQSEVSSNFARDFLPEGHMENIPLADSSIQQCYIFRTTAGVGYTVESSSDLTNWTFQDEIYGLGHEYVVTMREYTPPPPPPPGTPPASRPAPAINASIRLQRASGPEGGTVVAWPSHDHGGPIVVRIAGNMDLGWNLIPLFSNRFDGYYFFIWHPPDGVAPPSSNPVLGPKDSALLAVLEASLPAMNQQVTDSVFRSRNSPLPSPEPPGSKRFWRVKVDPDVDTDQDGSPDWAEFEIVARGTGLLVPGVIGEAFNADTNDDGIPDGLQLDSDSDGIPDAIDINLSDDTATFPIGPVPRYAMFPITNSQPAADWPSPLKISDKGTVLYQNGTWSGGMWTSLKPPVGIKPGAYATAISINDNDVVLGTAHRKIRDDPEDFANLICSWDDPQAVASFITANKDGATHYPSWSYSSPSRFRSPGPVLSNDGHFFMPTWAWEDDKFLWQHNGYWKIPAGGNAASEVAGDTGSFFNQGPTLKWGVKMEIDSNGNEVWSNPVKGMIYAPNALPELPFSWNIVLAHPGSPVMTLPPSTSEQQAMAFVKGKWVTSKTFGKAIDVAADGTAIGQGNSAVRGPILINGDWKGIFNYAPKVPDMWKDSTVKLLDTTPGGWVLAERGVWHLLGISYPEHSVLLPIRADGVDPALSIPPLVPPADPPEYFYGGVDQTSTTALGGTGNVPEIWIMAPNGGASNSVRFQSPLNPNCKLTLESDADVGFTPGELDSNDMIVQVNGKKTATADFSAKLKLGGILDSLSVPLKIKIMKKRTVKVAVHKVFGIDGSGNQTVPANFLAMSDLENYLNEVFGKQTNTYFQCAAYDEKGPAGTGIDFDFSNGASDNWVSYQIGDPEVQALTANPKSVGGSNATANIDIWVFGGGVRMADSSRSYYGYQIGNEFEGKILIDGDLLGKQGPANELSAQLLDVFAHEIGHVMVGWGHSDEGNCRTVLKWKSSFSDAKYDRDSRNNKRLMSGGESRKSSTPSKQLIKKEWDLIEAWLKKQEDDGKL